jgi:hypothetical protein
MRDRSVVVPTMAVLRKKPRLMTCRVKAGLFSFGRDTTNARRH